MAEHWARARRRDLAAALATAVIAVAAGCSGWLAWRTERAVEANLKCQVAVNSEFRRTIEDRQRSEDAVFEAQRQLLAVPPGDPERSLRARQVYISAIDAVQAARRDNPFPTRDC